MTEESSSDPIARRRAQRQSYLRALYQRVDADVSEFVNGYDIAHELGIGREDAARLFAYFEEKGLVRVDDHREGTLRITADGVDRVEGEAE
jgi:Mn-dependent DtxR family transcriptional regulator